LRFDVIANEVQIVNFDPQARAEALGRVISRDGCVVHKDEGVAQTLGTGRTGFLRRGNVKAMICAACGKEMQLLSL